MLNPIDNNPLQAAQKKIQQYLDDNYSGLSLRPVATLTLPQGWRFVYESYLLLNIRLRNTLLILYVDNNPGSYIVVEEDGYSNETRDFISRFVRELGRAEIPSLEDATIQVLN